MSDTVPLKVYYDAVCPGCRRDRARYERLAGEAGEAVQWCNVTDHEAELKAQGIDPRAALLSLHVADAEGRIVDGIEAYVLLMRRVPRLRPLAVLIGLPGVRDVLGWGYRRWVRRRLTREGRLP